MFRHDLKDFVFESRSKIMISKLQWEAINSARKVRDVSLKNLKLEVEQLCLNLEDYILKRFNTVNASFVNKRWLDDAIKDFYNPKQKAEIPETVLDYFPLFLEEKKRKVSNRTLIRYTTVYNVYVRFVNLGESNPLIEEIGPEFQSKFEDFCEEENYANSTSIKFIEVIKTLCKSASQKGIQLNPRFESITFQKRKNPVIYLNNNELNIISKLENTVLGDRLSRVRDWLLISCFTGQRVSDFMNFNNKNIREIEGVLLLDIVQKKTKKDISIPILPAVKQILDKNQGKFPRAISEQKFNEYVKELGEIAGLHEMVYGGVFRVDNNGEKRKEFGEYPKYKLITSHIGRRSFASNLYGKFPTPLIMNVTGHSKESTFLEYIGKTSGDMAIDLARRYEGMISG